MITEGIRLAEYPFYERTSILPWPTWCFRPSLEAHGIIWSVQAGIATHSATALFEAPLETNWRFVGEKRTMHALEILVDLTSWCNGRRAEKVEFIKGLGGVGKTQLTRDLLDPGLVERRRLEFMAMLGINWGATPVSYLSNDRFNQTTYGDRAAIPSNSPRVDREQMTGHHNGSLVEYDHDDTFRTSVPRPRTHVGGILDGLSIDAIPDNCSTHNLISRADVGKLTAKDNVSPEINYFGLPDQTVMKSTGTINLPFAYADQPNRLYSLLFYIFDSCPGGIILGKEFLQKTRLFAQENLHRLKRCLSSVPRNSFRLVDDTSQRLHGRLAEASGLDKHMAVVLDFGADRNVMSLKFANERKYDIKRDPEHRGMLVFADGTERETVGQVETWWTFASGERVPVMYEVLPECFADVVLGDEFIWEHQVYRDHADSIQDLDTALDLPEVHYMGWKHNWFGGLAKIASFVGGSANNLAPLPPHSGQTQSISLSYDEELQRQEEWNDKFDDGYSSPLVEWYLEHQRREHFEEKLLPGWHFDPAGRPLIQRYSSEHPIISSTGTI